MTCKERLKNLNLPDYLSEVQKQEILKAIKNGTPIIVNGAQGSTGKTTLVNCLRKSGVTAFEEWEVRKISLNKKLT